MRFASPNAPHREDAFDLGHGVSIQFNPDAIPDIQWTHIDGPLLYMRNCQIHWLTLWERFLCWRGIADAYSLEAQHAPDFVRRWNERLARSRGAS